MPSPTLTPKPQTKKAMIEKNTQDNKIRNEFGGGRDLYLVLLIGLAAVEQEH